jgi:hypothetical protein
MNNEPEHDQQPVNQTSDLVITFSCNTPDQLLFNLCITRTEDPAQ